MRRKGWDPQAEDMPAILAIHNAVNERGWSQVVEWETALHGNADVKLVRFAGRPNDLSPKARVRNWFGSALPFDRHDWIVTRGDKEVGG
jgi:cytochrome c heme-lyase